MLLEWIASSCSVEWTLLEKFLNVGSGIHYQQDKSDLDDAKRKAMNESFSQVNWEVDYRWNPPKRKTLWLLEQKLSEIMFFSKAMLNICFPWFLVCEWIDQDGYTHYTGIWTERGTNSVAGSIVDHVNLFSSACTTHNVTISVLETKSSSAAKAENQLYQVCIY